MPWPVALVLAAGLAALAGCAEQRKFEPERIPTPVGILHVKGWTRQDEQFCARVEFQRGNYSTGIYDLVLVGPDGGRARPEEVQDKASPRRPMTLSLGLGLGVGIGGSGVGFGGISAPVYSAAGAPSKIDLEACWLIEAALPLEQTRLEIRLLSFRADGVEAITVPLEMSRPAGETPEAQRKKTREVDFRLAEEPLRKEMEF